MRSMGIAVAAALVLSIVALVGVGEPEPASGQSSEDSVRTVTVAGSGFVETTPDEATFSFGVERRGETAEQALSAASSVVEKVVDALKRLGIDAGDIQTQQISVSPIFADDGRRLEGYSASSSVSVNLKELDRTGAVIDAAVKAGANQIYGPALSVSDQDELYRDALRKAFTDAREKAQALASASGVSLGRVVAVSEGGSGPPQPFAEIAGRASADQAQIEPGRQRVEASVSVTFSIQ